MKICIMTKGDLMIKRLGYWQDRCDPKMGADPKLIPNLNKKLWQPYVDGEQYPWPGDLVDKNFWEIHDRNKIVQYLKLGLPCNHFRGYSRCRLCDDTLSSFERTDGIWCWPDKLEHYIDGHNVMLPEEFFNFNSEDFEKALQKQNIEPSAIQDGIKFFHFKVDDQFWVNWSRHKFGVSSNGRTLASGAKRSGFKSLHPSHPEGT